MKIFEWDDNRKHLLSVLWIFLTVNYIYCDIFTLHLSKYLEAFLAGQVGSIKITEEFLFIFAVVMQIPMVMIVLSRVLTFKLNRYSNIIAGFITTTVQAYTVTMGGTLHYMFFSFFEICTGLFIIYLAVTWKQEATL
ncbi:hypothetical protein PSECIP111951_00111 [Pseudoalteromonas holothuriae]|uniref:Uncharacterized protein n=2 Tax=Pseudoalteromonas holothuriae TaxID=2963714 RepID=A0A9W4QTT7_9GAMM|nr:hypothetical protein PSECIP111951_00111 [Pseudoalteromonas sp. CIP111951]CAH9052629.1 hypothetical protein PSECIP111854_01008 [Pseudoalteromonas sp. CIP111854]